MNIKIISKIDEKPVRTTFSMGITNANTVYQDFPVKTLVSELLLSSELKGNIEDPYYYFSLPYDSIKKKMDLVMLTHGWRGYNWTSDLTRTFTYQPDEAYSVIGRISGFMNRPESQRKISLLVQGGNMIKRHTYTDNKGFFVFHNLDVREKSMAYITIEKETIGKKKKGISGLNIDFFELGKWQWPSVPVTSLTTYKQVKNYTDYLIDIFKEKQELENLRKQYGKYLLDEVVITAKRRTIPGSWNRNMGYADIVIDSAEITQKHEKHTRLLDVLLAEVPGFTQTGSNFLLNNKQVFFQIDGDILEYIPGRPRELLYQTLENIEGKDIRALEILTSRNLLFSYNSKRPLENRLYDKHNRNTGSVIVVTTKSGKGFNLGQENGTYRHPIQGSSIAKEFYHPKYYPVEPYDQAVFDKRPILFWNPTVETDENGEAEINLTVGAYMKNNLQMEIEGIDGKGHIGSERKIIILDE